MSHLTLTQALAQAEAQAHSTLPPELHERLRGAVALVKEGRVFQTTAGAWQVESTSPAGLTYTVNGTCACQDAHYNHPPQGLCKHRLAMFLSQRVLSLMQPPAAPGVPADGQAPREVPGYTQRPAPDAVGSTDTTPLYEAPASCNVYVTISGHRVQVTLRDSDEQHMLERLAVLLQQYPAPQVPVQASSQPQGQGQGGYCLVHQTAMKENVKDGRRWFSHRLPEGGFCKGIRR